MMYFFKASVIVLLCFLQCFSVSAPAPGGSVSKSYASLPKPILSPYYLYFGNPATSTLADAYDTLGLRAATIGFVTAQNWSCERSNDLKSLVPDIQAFIQKGGAISLSFGGNLMNQAHPRQHIQQACGDVPSLTELIKGAMSTFKTTNIEFDIEDQPLLMDTAASTRLAQALAQVKQDVPDVYITYTLGCFTHGMPQLQYAYVQTAKANGVVIDSLALMTMNMGGKDVAVDSQTAVVGGAAQLATIYGISLADAFKKMGMVPAIGIDNKRALLDLHGMAALQQFATRWEMSIMSYWSFNRDFPGDNSAVNQTLNSSSSPDQKYPAQFFRTLLSSVAPATAATITTSVINAAVPLPPRTDFRPVQKAPNPPLDHAAVPGAKSLTEGFNNQIRRQLQMEQTRRRWRTRGRKHVLEELTLCFTYGTC